MFIIHKCILTCGVQKIQGVLSVHPSKFVRGIYLFGKRNGINSFPFVRRGEKPVKIAWAKSNSLVWITRDLLQILNGDKRAYDENNFTSPQTLVVPKDHWDEPGYMLTCVAAASWSPFPTDRVTMSPFKRYRLHFFRLSIMAHFSFAEKINGLYSLLKSEIVDAQIARSKPAPDVNVTGKVILLTGATSGTVPWRNNLMSRDRPRNRASFGHFWGSSHYYCSEWKARE